MTTTTTRRTVVKGTAWAIPAVTIAAAAPATAASTPCTPPNLSADVRTGMQDNSAGGSIIVRNTRAVAIPAGTVIRMTFIRDVVLWNQDVAAISVDGAVASVDHGGDGTFNATIVAEASTPAQNMVVKSEADALNADPNQAARWQRTERTAQVTITLNEALSARNTMRFSVPASDGIGTVSIVPQTTTAVVDANGCAGTLTTTSSTTDPQERAQIIPADQYTPPTATSDPTPSPTTTDDGGIGGIGGGAGG